MNVEITNQFLERWKTKNGGWTKKQLMLLKITWPPTKGWKERVIGITISMQEANEFKNISEKSK